MSTVSFRGTLRQIEPDVHVMFKALHLTCPDEGSCRSCVFLVLMCAERVELMVLHSGVGAYKLLCYIHQ